MSAQLQAPRPHGRVRDVPARPHPVGDKKIVAVRLVGGAIALWALVVLLGILVTHVLVHGPVQSFDRGVDVWFAAHRTGTWNTITDVSTIMAQTQTVIAVTAVVVLLLRWRLRRWYESGILVVAMVGELVVFYAATKIVHRPRPAVPRLDVAPPTSSFPSGHTAAAVALYGCIALLVLWIYGRRPATWIVVAVACCIPVAVGLSRVYRGMHYPTDVVAGALTGGLWLLLVITTLLPQRRTAKRRGRDPASR
jgi:membrane-associated phospholipid phosphatase